MTQPEMDAALQGEGNLSATMDVVDEHDAAFGGEGTLTAYMTPVQPAQGVMDQRLLHVQRCGCNLSVVPPTPADQDTPSTRLGWLPGFPMDQPSGYQNRTTKPSPRQRHPVNTNKKMDIPTWLGQNPDEWPDGNPTPTPVNFLEEFTSDLGSWTTVGNNVWWDNSVGYPTAGSNKQF